MFRFVWRYVRGRLGRSVALLAGMLVATTGFVVLTGSAAASRLEVTGAVQGGTRAAYDILVRPKGSRTSLEAADGLVRPNYLSGQFGGVTTGDWAAVRSVPGVAVAAPIAMVGYSTMGLPAPLDITDAVDRTAETQVIRVDPTFLAERGLSKGRATPLYVYVTRRPVIRPEVPKGIFNDTDDIRYSDGKSYPIDECGGGAVLAVREVLPGGRTAPVCEVASQAPDGPDPYQRTPVLVARMLPDGRFDLRRNQAVADVQPEERLRVDIPWEMPFLLAAVDPEAESRLVGLSDAMVKGRPLKRDDAPWRQDGADVGNRTFPVLASSRAYVDAVVSAVYTRLRPPVVAGLPSKELTTALRGAPATATGGGQSDVDANYRGRMEQIVDRGQGGAALDAVIQPGPTQYDRLPDGTLRAVTRPGDERIFDTPSRIGGSRPWLTTDQWFRPLTNHVLLDDPSGTRFQSWTPIGMFDPERLTGFSDLARVPLETYEAPSAQGADAVSRTALGDRPLLPSGNPGGYLTPPPMLLTSMSVLPDLLTGPAAAQGKAPISAIRVRVAGVDGYSRESAERVRIAAEEIARRTGLDVDITLGSSQAARTVELPAGAFGRPVLRLTERWSSIGVASRIVEAVDRKSLVLFALVLVVCALFLSNAVSAAVRDRRTELAVLTCLGWPPGRVTAALLGELALLGLFAGLLSVGLAWPLGRLLGVHVSPGHALLAVPVAGAASTSGHAGRLRLR
ncbi:FtsX-like permease family protein, partial [Actinoplanes sp. NPDC048791]|uniref:FtsX-like permease family protein n=1 Tax=Actinoplanes sp. NPDC048791 TaxID=3154623 RepID=UPI0033FE4C55